MSRIAIAVACLASLFSVIAQSDEPSKAATAASAAMGPPKPAEELSQLKPLEGTWHCEGTVPASPMGPEHKVKSTMSFKPDLNRFWYEVTFETQKTKDNPMTVKFRGYWGYDSLEKNFVRVGMSSFGDWLSLTSDGWKGDQMIWTGPLEGFMGKKAQFRHTLDRKSDKEFVDNFEVNTGGDQWMPLTVNDICKK